MKKIKIAIFIQICLLPIMLFLVFWFSLFSSVSSVDSKIMETFQHNNHIVYSNGSSIIYNKSKLDIISNIKNSDDNNIKDSNGNYFSYKNPDLEIISIVEWIDDNHIIYSKEEDNSKNYYLIDSNENTSLLYSSNDLDEYGIIYKDSILYFISSDNTYNKYDNNVLRKINKSDYYEARDGNRYKIDIVYKNDSNEIESINVEDNLNYAKTSIDKDLLITNRLIKKLGEYSEINILNYYVFNDELIIQVITNNYIIALRYENDTLYYFDYSNRYDSIIYEHNLKNTTKCYFINNLKMPLLRYVRLS